MIRPGKYDDQAQEIQRQVKATAVLLAVFDGNAGSGFSVVCRPEIMPQIPRILRRLADLIEETEKTDAQNEDN